MNKADFYLLAGSRPSDLIHFTCKLVEKAFRQEHKIHIQAASPEQLEDLDDALWSFKPDSFLPHTIGQGQHQDYPITLDIISRNQGHRDLLIILVPELPVNCHEFKRLGLIAPNQDTRLQAARVSYKQLKSEGIDAQIHDFRKKS